MTLPATTSSEQPTLYLIPQPDPGTDEGRRVLTAMAILAQDPNQKIVLNWMNEQFKVFQERCISFKDTALSNSQGAAQVLSDILWIQARAAEVLRAQAARQQQAKQQ